MARTEILISGFGGQGVVRMGQILGLCAINQGHRVTMLKSHGTETRGGYVRAQLVISPEYVDSPVVEHADVFVAFSQPAYTKFLEMCSGTVMYDPEMRISVRALTGAGVAISAPRAEQVRARPRAPSLCPRPLWERGNRDSSACTGRGAFRRLPLLRAGGGDESGVRVRA